MLLGGFMIFICEFVFDFVADFIFDVQIMICPNLAHHCQNQRKRIILSQGNKICNLI